MVRMGKGTLLVGLMVCWAGSLAAQTGFVTGHVRSAVSGTGLPGMVVSAYNVTGQLVQSEVTRSDGSYTLALPAATYKFLAYDPTGTFATDFYRAASSFATSAEVGLAPGATVPSIDFSLPKGFFIAGFVQGPPGTSVADVVVAVYNLNGTRRGFQKAGPTGAYSVVVPAGTYKIAAYDERLVLATEFYSDVNSFEKAQTVGVTTNISLSFQLNLGGRVSGMVTERQGGGGLEGLIVRAYDLNGVIVAEGVTDPAGRYSFVLPAGTFKLGAVDREDRFSPGYFGNVRDFGSAPTISVTAGQQTSGLSFSLERVAVEPRSFTLYIPVSASNEGAGGTFFRTDVWIQNPTDSPLQVEIRHLPPPSSGLQPIDRIVIVPPRGQKQLRDIVATEFQRTGGGALRLTATARFAATSRTYNDPANPAIGTSGLSISAEQISASLSRAVIPALSNSAGFRSNVGVFNPGLSAIEVEYSLFDQDGVLLNRKVQPLQPMEWFQTNIFAFMNASGIQVDNAYLTLWSTQGSFFSYGTVVDAKSGDSTLILPTADSSVEPE